MESRSKYLDKIQVAVSKEENRKSLEAGLTVLTILILFLAFFAPAIKNIQDKLIKAKDLSGKQEILKEILGKYKTASLYYNQLTSYEQGIFNKIPIDPDPAESLRGIDTVATKNGVTFSQSSLVKKEDGEEIYKFTLRGEFAKIQTFFKDISKHDRFYKVSNLILTSLDSQDNLELNLTTQVTSYYYEEQ